MPIEQLFCTGPAPSSLPTAATLMMKAAEPSVPLGCLTVYYLEMEGRDRHSIILKCILNIFVETVAQELKCSNSEAVPQRGTFPSKKSAHEEYGKWQTGRKL